MIEIENTAYYTSSIVSETVSKDPVPMTERLQQNTYQTTEIGESSFLHLDHSSAIRAAAT
jgi:hypothetical protein